MKRVIQLNILLYFVFISFNIIPCNGQKTTEFKLHGTIENSYNGRIILSYGLTNDTSTVSNGYFSFKGNIQNPESSCLSYANQRIFFYIEPSDMKLIISSLLPLGYNLSGSKTNDENCILEQDRSPLLEKKNQIHKIIQNITNPHKKQALEQSVDSINNNLQLISINFIKSHPNSYVSLDELRCLEMNDSSIDMIRNMFEDLENNLKNTSKGKKVNKSIELYENTIMGLPAPDFTTIGYNEEKISLSSFRGKTVILEFWASWCAPCIQSILHLKTLYHKYQEKGLTIIGISIDSNKNSWENAIKKYQLDIWPQALAIVDIKNDQKGEISNSEIISLYPTNPIPKMIVIDKKGKIIKKWVGYSQEHEKEQNSFFDSHFK